MTHSIPRYRCSYCAGFIKHGDMFMKSMNAEIMYLDQACTRKLARAMVEYLANIEDSPEKLLARKAYGDKALKRGKKSAEEAFD